VRGCAASGATLARRRRSSDWETTRPESRGRFVSAHTLVPGSKVGNVWASKNEGDQSGQVYKITVGREDLNVKEMRAAINARMGLNTWAAFFGSGANAEIAGAALWQLGPTVNFLTAGAAGAIATVVYVASLRKNPRSPRPRNGIS
jgi:hypothetical protein